MPPRWLLVGLVGSVAALMIAAAVAAWSLLLDESRGRPTRLLAEARAATEAGDNPRAFNAWHAWNATDSSTAATLTLEAQLAQMLNRGRDAELLAERITRIDPTSTEAWTIRLNRLRVLDQPAEALEVGLSALPGLRTPGARRAVLTATTLATLAEVPDAEARSQLDRWIAADPVDIDAQAARMARIAAVPHPGDPNRATRIIELGRIVDRHPDHVAAREALTVALADSGEVDRGRAVLEAWPKPSRGHRFDRLQGRWDLEYDHQPAQAAEGFRRALIATPHDWKLHYGLARSSKMIGQIDDARAEALAVARLRERLEPSTLGPRLSTDFDRINKASEDDARPAMLDLAALSRSVGLAKLADAWEREAGRGSLMHARASDSPSLR